jgi:hypothetical protein
MHFPQSYHDYIGLDESLFSAKPDRGDVFRSSTFKKLKDAFLKDAPDDFVLFGEKGVGKSVLLINTLVHLPVNEWEAFYAHPVLGVSDVSGLEGQIKSFLAPTDAENIEKAIAQFAKEKRGFVFAVDEADAYKNLNEFCKSLREKFDSQGVPLKVIKSHRKPQNGSLAFELASIEEGEIRDYLDWGIKDYTKLKNAGFHELSDYIFGISGGNFAEMRRLLDIMLVEFLDSSAVGVTPELCLIASNKYYSGAFYKHSSQQVYKPGINNAS